MTSLTEKIERENTIKSPIHGDFFCIERLNSWFFWQIENGSIQLVCWRKYF